MLYSCNLYWGGSFRYTVSEIWSQKGQSFGYRLSTNWKNRAEQVASLAHSFSTDNLTLKPKWVDGGQDTGTLGETDTESFSWAALSQPSLHSQMVCQQAGTTVRALPHKIKKPFDKKICFILHDVYLCCVLVCADEYKCPRRRAEGIRCPGDGVTGGSKPPDMDGVQTPNLGPMQKQYLLFASGLSLQSPLRPFLNRMTKNRKQN